MDIVAIDGIKAFGRHGALPEEAVLGQPFVVDIALEMDLSKIGMTDDLSQGVSYADVYQIVIEHITTKRYKLIETLCFSILKAILEHDEKIMAVTVTVKKPQAPLYGEFEHAKVIMKRDRDAIGLS